MSIACAVATYRFLLQHGAGLSANKCTRLTFALTPLKGTYEGMKRSLQTFPFLRHCFCLKYSELASAGAQTDAANQNRRNAGHGKPFSVGQASKWYGRRPPGPVCRR